MICLRRKNIIRRKRAFAEYFDIRHVKQFLLAIVAHADILTHPRQGAFACNTTAKIPRGLRQHDVIAARTKSTRSL